MRLDELSFEIRLERLTTKGSSSGRIMRLVPVFISETHNLDELQNVCPSSSRRIMHPHNKNGHRVIIHLPKPFPSSKNFYFQNEAKCKTFHVKMSFICMRIKIHIISVALHIVSLRNRLKATQKSPIFQFTCYKKNYIFGLKFLDY